MDATCKECKASKPVSQFELMPSGKPRGQCKACRQAKRNAAARQKQSEIDRDSVPKPESCNECGRGCPEVDFKWRSDAAAGGWRPTCNDCTGKKGYAQAYRKRKMETDPDAYRARNAATHRAWVERQRADVRD